MSDNREDCPSCGHWVDLTSGPCFECGYRRNDPAVRRVQTIFLRLLRERRPDHPLVAQYEHLLSEATEGER